MDTDTLLKLMASGRLQPSDIRALAGGEKALAANSAIAGPENPFDCCTRQVFGYSIWSNTTATFFNWLRPELIPSQRSLNFYVLDWRNQLDQSPSSDDDWCAVPSYTGQPIKGCKIDYCFDPNMYYYTGRQVITPADLQNVCFQNPVTDINGQPIRNQEDYEQFMMFNRQMMISAKSVVVDDSATPSQEDGIEAWFDNFATRHPELTSTCLEELSPVDVDLTGVDCSDVLTKVYNRVWEIEQKVGMLTGRPTIPANYWVLLMNPLDAECVLRCQSCVNVCNAPIVLSPELMTPAGRAVFYADYNNRLTGGAFGQGFFELRDGRQISIIRDWNVTRGTFYLLVKGWTGNENAMRLAVNNWSEWVSYQRPGTGVTIQTLANGGLLYITAPDGICQKAHLRWNWRLFSNAPWLQTRFTDLAACAEPTDPRWATLPNLTGATPCDQVERGIQ